MRSLLTGYRHKTLVRWTFHHLGPLKPVHGVQDMEYVCSGLCPHSPPTWTVQFVPDTHNTRHCFWKNFSRMHNRLSVEALLMCCMWWNIFMWSSSISPKVVPGARSVVFSVNSPPHSLLRLLQASPRQPRFTSHRGIWQVCTSRRCQHQLLLPETCFFSILEHTKTYHNGNLMTYC